MRDVVFVGRTCAIGVALSEVGVGIVRADGFAELSDVGSSGSCSLASRLAFSIVPERSIRTDSYAVPRDRVSK